MDGRDQECVVNKTLPYKTGVLMAVCDDELYYPMMMVMGDEKATTLQSQVMQKVEYRLDSFVQKLDPIIIGKGRKPVKSENSFSGK